MEKSPFGILFVCTGNICRSPTAEAVFRHKVRGLDLENHFLIDSAGTHAYHIGNSPDARSMETAMKRGVDMSYLRARKVEPTDFMRFDLILAMDAGHYQILETMVPREGARARLAYFLEGDADVPDPYYGQKDGFEHVFDLVDQACERILAEWKAQNGL